MVGHRLKTKQTSGDGVMVRQVMVAEALDIARETYFAIVMDRAFQGPVLVGSPEGGVDIEEVAKTSPEKIFKVFVKNSFDANTVVVVTMAMLLLPWLLYWTSQAHDVIVMLLLFVFL